MDADSNEALGDFQLHAERVKQPQSKLDMISRNCTFGSFAFTEREVIVSRPKSEAVE